MKAVREKSTLKKDNQLVFSLEALPDLSKTRSFFTLATTTHITDTNMTWNLGPAPQVSHQWRQ